MALLLWLPSGYTEVLGDARAQPTPVLPAKVMQLGEEDLELAKQRLDAFDFVGIFEEMDRSLQILKLELGLNAPMPKRNQSSGLLAVDLTNEQEARLAEINVLDKELYSYALEKFRAYTPPSNPKPSRSSRPWNRLFSLLHSRYLNRSMKS